MHGDTYGVEIREGAEVIGVDGEKLGQVSHIEGDMIVVRKGLFFPKDHFIPVGAVASVDADNVYLSVSSDAALHGDWGTVETGTMSQGGVSGYADQDVSLAGNRDGFDVDPQPFEHGQNTQRTHINADDELLVPVVEEELTARTHEVERGEVRVHKDVIEEQRTLEVPVTEEEVEITRRHVNRAVTDADHAFEEGTIEVPLRGEEVDIEKRTRVVEEIDIDKTARQHTEVVDGTVRREEVHIEGDNIDVERNRDVDGGTRRNGGF
jgi:uncharacterized protein (TIGR02271 family)